MNELIYLLVVPVVLKFSDWYKDEIKEFFRTFSFRKYWYEIIMLIITICIIVMTIAIVKYAP